MSAREEFPALAGLLECDHLGIIEQLELRDALDSVDAAPAWHDRPTGPGLWVCVEEDGPAAYNLSDDGAVQLWDAINSGCVFGPILLDPGGE